MILSNKTREGAQNWRFVALRPFRHNMEVVENPFLSVGHDPLGACDLEPSGGLSSPGNKYCFTPPNNNYVNFRKIFH